jgi:PAS domain-containing protein
VTRGDLGEGSGDPSPVEGDDVIDTESLEQIETQVARIAGPAFAVDLHGRVVAWNRGAEALFGTPAPEAVGHPCAVVIRGTDRTGRVLCRAACPWLLIARSAIRADIPMLARRGPRPSARVEVVMRHKVMRNRLRRPVAVLHMAQ